MYHALEWLSIDRYIGVKMSILIMDDDDIFKKILMNITKEGDEIA